MNEHRAVVITPYDDRDRETWNAFVRRSKNGTPMHQRDFVEYHRHRFQDASLMAHRAGRLVGLLPANWVEAPQGGVLQSHGGLTYGGWVTDEVMTVPLMLDVFEALGRHCADVGVAAVHYRAIPRPYHRLPADEDDYALFRVGAVRVRHEVSSVLNLRSPVRWAERRRRALKKAAAAGLAVTTSRDFGAFWDVLAEVLRSRHGVDPVHSAAELEHLAERFPDQIVLHVARDPDGHLLAGVLVIDCGQTVHTQYLASSPRGRQTGALDAVVHALTTDVYADRTYLSFGVSTEDGGKHLNQGLVEQKEMFGARAVTCSAYDWDVANWLAQTTSAATS